jgi:arsenite-transporting ATPase
LPETTPVTEAAALQEDLRRASIEPFAWVINRSLSGSGTQDRVLAARMNLERAQIARVAEGLARRAYLIPWRAEPPIGVSALTELTVQVGAGMARLA